MTPGQPRRRYPRFKWTSEASIIMGRWWPIRRTLRGRIVDYSKTGATVSIPKSSPLASGSRISLRWKIPVDFSSNKVQECKMAAEVVDQRLTGEKFDTYGVRFHQLIDERIEAQAGWFQRMLAAATAAAIAASIIYLKASNLLWSYDSPLFIIYSLVAGYFIFSRMLIVAFYYKEPEDVGYLPTVTAVIAAMNEVDCIAPTVEHCVRSNYPPELMEIIVIDDGSTDHTWEALENLKLKYPQLKLIRFEKNRGKRYAMAAGAKAATGEILVYIDSDSFVEPEAIYRIVQPFKEKAIGAVAGHVLVAVEPDNVISKMESVRYYISHRILKAAESVFGAVTCCPGAFSAYRRETVMNVMDAWLNQTFLGIRATFGDDRSLTNFILRTHQVIFHNGARCATKVPSQWLKYFKQQLRWKKSWTRETFIACCLMYKEHPVAAASYYAGILLTFLSPLVAVHSLIYMPLILHLMNPLPYIAGLLLSYLFLCLVCYYYTRTPYWFYGMNFALLYLFVLSWQNYYAMITVNRTTWGTR